MSNSFGNFVPEVDDFISPILARYQSIFCTYYKKITKDFMFKNVYENINLSYFENKTKIDLLSIIMCSEK